MGRKPLLEKKVHYDHGKMRCEKLIRCSKKEICRFQRQFMLNGLVISGLKKYTQCTANNICAEAVPLILRYVYETMEK
jgi:hypothetical protein